MTLRTKSSLVTLVPKVLRDGAPGHPLALCMPPTCSTVGFFYLFCSPASRLLCMLSLLPGRFFPQLFAWLVLIHISGLRINVSFIILEISSTSLPFPKKKKKISPIHHSASVSIATALVQNLISSGLDCSLLSILAC